MREEELKKEYAIKMLKAEIEHEAQYEGLDRMIYILECRINDIENTKIQLQHLKDIKEDRAKCLLNNTKE